VTADLFDFFVAGLTIKADAVLPQVAVIFDFFYGNWGYSRKPTTF
jgi:hypothetical protein